MTGTLIVLAVVAGIIYSWRRYWVWRNTPPEGYSLRINDQGGSYERVTAIDPTGKAVTSGNYTSIYGLNGAARKAISGAREHQRFTNRRSNDMEKFNQKYLGDK